MRLWLSLGKTPGLLSVPWEFLYLQPTFLASQRKTPIVRFLRTDAPVAPRRIEKEVRILGVIASPAGLPPLKVELERERVDKALAKARQNREVTVDWLDPATPKALRLKLQEGDYHILHFVGHSGYVEDSEGADGGGGVIYLENEDHSKAPISDSQLVNLLGDQDSLRLVVLNSCEGARTSVRDPFAGIATSIVALGIPAVVAMQFEITDDAAIAFAEELYGSLIAREETIDVAVAEARKAVFTEVNETEWATPVLFLRNEDGRLFDFVPVVPVGRRPTRDRAARDPMRRSSSDRSARPGWRRRSSRSRSSPAARRELAGLVRRCDGEPRPEPGDSVRRRRARARANRPRPRRHRASRRPSRPSSRPPRRRRQPFPTVPAPANGPGLARSRTCSRPPARSRPRSAISARSCPTRAPMGSRPGRRPTRPASTTPIPTWIPNGCRPRLHEDRGRRIARSSTSSRASGSDPDGAVGHRASWSRIRSAATQPSGVREHAPAWLAGRQPPLRPDQPMRSGTRLRRGHHAVRSDLDRRLHRRHATEPIVRQPGWSDIRHISVDPNGRPDPGHRPERAGRWRGARGLGRRSRATSGRCCPARAA